MGVVAMHVLIVEDDALVASGIRAGLEHAGWSVEVVGSLSAADHALSVLQSDVVVLDRRLTDGDGIDLLRQWRVREIGVPVLMLTALDAIEHRIEGLSVGADDYLVKPFDLDELIARLHALLRRAAGRASPDIVHGPLRFDPRTRGLTMAGHHVSLSRRETALLETFLQAPGQVLSAARLHDSLYGFNDSVESNALNVHLHHLRRKLGAEVIETVRGLGYRLGTAQTLHDMVSIRRQQT